MKVEERTNNIFRNNVSIKIVKGYYEKCLIHYFPVPFSFFINFFLLFSLQISRQSIDACKDYFRDDLLKADWALMVELKKLFQIL